MSILSNRKSKQFPNPPNQENFVKVTQNNDLTQKISNSNEKYRPENNNQMTEQQLKHLQQREQICKGICHPRIRELIFAHSNPKELLKSKHINDRAEELQANKVNLQLLQERKWLTKKGRKHLIDFDDNERQQMKFCFNALDQRKEGSIGIDELEELLLSVGLMSSREEVKQLIDSVDEDKSGKIEFSEFLKMILNDEGENEEIVMFFKFIINENRKRQREQIKNNITANTNNNKFPAKSVGPRKITEQNNEVPFTTKKKISLVTEKQNIGAFNLSQIEHRQTSKPSEKDKRQFNKLEHVPASKEVSNNAVLSILDRFPHPKNLPFGMVVSHIRRKHMLTALKIGKPSALKSGEKSFSEASKSYHSIGTSKLTSNSNVRDSRKLNNKHYSQEDVQKGQTVMNSLKKMWDRRLLRQIKDDKREHALSTSRKFFNQHPSQSKSSNFKPHVNYS